MANQEHLDLLKQGVEMWNQWRKEYPDIKPDLSDTNLKGANLKDVCLNGTLLRRSDLNRTILIDAALIGANFHFANLSDANLSGATCHKADLSDATLHRVDLSDADLSKANLLFADLSDATLHRADLSGASLMKTVFGNTDLRWVKGLEKTKHRGPSIIGIDTVYRSQGLIPETFLRNAGVPASFCEVMSSIVNRPIEYYTCFISYAHLDESFAHRLHADLQSKGVRCWFAPEDLKIGDHYHQRIDESIHLYDKLILILSAHAVQSAWVEREVVTAREKEDRESRPVLFPLRLDDAVMNTTKAWAADVRRRWQIGDFTQWKHQDAYQQVFERLLRDLKARETP